MAKAIVNQEPKPLDYDVPETQTAEGERSQKAVVNQAPKGDTTVNLTKNEVKEMIKETEGKGGSGNVPEPTAADVGKVLKAIAAGEMSWEESELDIYELPYEPSQAQLREAMKHFIIHYSPNNSEANKLYFLKQSEEFGFVGTPEEYHSCSYAIVKVFGEDGYLDGYELAISEDSNYAYMDIFNYNSSEEMFGLSRIRGGNLNEGKLVVVGSDSYGSCTTEYRGFDLTSIPYDNELVMPANLASGKLPLEAMLSCTEQQYNIARATLIKVCKRGYLNYGYVRLLLGYCGSTITSQEEEVLDATFGVKPIGDAGFQYGVRLSKNGGSYNIIVGIDEV